MSAHGQEAGTPLLITSLQSPAAVRLRRWLFGCALVITHLLIGGAGYALSTSGGGPVESVTAPAVEQAAAQTAADPVSASTTEDNTEPGTISSEIAGAEDGVEATVAPIAETSTSRFVDIPTARVIDTRPSGPVAENGTASVDLTPHISPDATAVALSISVIEPLVAGPVTAKIDYGAVSVADLSAPMSSNLVIVPRATANELTMSLAGGGHLIVDIAGYFEPAASSAAGRFIPVAPQPIGRLWTETQGRETTLAVAESGLVPSTGVGSVIIRLRADVGDSGGRVRLGSGPDDLSNMVMWSPTSEGDRTRHGLAIVSLDDLGQLSMAYEGGTEINIDLLGYFTDDDAEVSSTGLFVPLPTTPLFDGRLASQTTTPIDVAGSLGTGANVSAVALTIIANADKPGSLFTYNAEVGLPRSTTLDVGGSVARATATAQAIDASGRALLFADVDTSVRIETTGYFLA